MDYLHAHGHRGNGSDLARGLRRKLPKCLCLTLALAAAVLVITVSACGSGASKNTDVGTGQNGKKGEMPQNVATGKRLFQQYCASCHGPQGDRMPIAPLNAKEFLGTRGDATLLMSISEGKGAMPAWGKPRGGPLTEAQVENVLAYLNYQAGRDSPSVQASAGKDLYTKNCAVCHGDEGDRIPNAPLGVKGFMDSRTDDSLFKSITDGIGQMPGMSQSKGGRLSDDEITSIIAYLHHAVDVNVAAAAAKGRAIYVANCLSCHGEKGDRITGVSLASIDFLTARGDGRLINVIGDGSGSMLGLGRSLQPTDIGALLAYLKAWAGLSASSAIVGSGPLAAPQDIFASNCIPCHGENGERVAGVQLKSKTFLQQLGDAGITQTISRGNAQGMPAFGKASGGPFGDDQITGIVTYLKSAAGISSGAAAAPASPPPSPSTSAGAPSTAPAGGAATADLVAKGKDVFSKNCTACHGDTRDKMPTAKLTDKDWVTQKGETGLTQSITNGKGGMPAWGGKLSGDEIKSVVAFLMNAVGASTGSGSATSSSAAPAGGGAPASGGAASADLVAKGKDVFTKNCTPCHGETRDRMPTAKLTDKDWVTQKGEAGLTQSITNGKGGMPAWGGKLSGDDIRSVVAFLMNAVGAGGSGGGAAADSGSSGGSAAASGDLIAKGKDIFATNCTPCHGQTRDKMPQAKLTDKSWVQQKGEAGLTQSISNGKGGMPAWSKAKGGQLSDDDIKAVVAFLINAVGAGEGGPSAAAPTATATEPEPVAPDIALGKQLFAKNCVPCHGPDGMRISIRPIGSKAFLAGKGNERIVASISGGRPSVGMPAWGKANGGTLGPNAVRSIALYLRDELSQ